MFPKLSRKIVLYNDGKIVVNKQIHRINSWQDGDNQLVRFVGECVIRAIYLYIVFHSISLILFDFGI